MADIRQALRAEGVSEETVNNLEKSWEKSTLEGYESIWKKWSSFAAENGIDRLRPSQLQFDAWLSSSVNGGAKEGSVEKYKSVHGGHYLGVDEPRSSVHLKFGGKQVDQGGCEGQWLKAT